MRKIGIICAMQKELDRLVKEFPEGGNIKCVLSGIGKVNAAVATERLISDFKPDCILSIGVAGTFVEGLNEGETVIVSRTAYHDVWCGSKFPFGQMMGLPQYFESDPQLLECAKANIENARTGLLCTGDQFYISQEEDERQKRLYPDALAIDMEGAAVAQVCHLHNMPFLALKIISDNHVDGHQMAHYEDFWKNMADRSFTAVRQLLNAIM